MRVARSGIDVSSTASRRTEATVGGFLNKAKAAAEQAAARAKEGVDDVQTKRKPNRARRPSQDADEDDAGVVRPR